MRIFAVLLVAVLLMPGLLMGFLLHPLFFLLIGAIIMVPIIFRMGVTAILLVLGLAVLLPLILLAIAGATDAY